MQRQDLNHQAYAGVSQHRDEAAFEFLQRSSALVPGYPHDVSRKSIGERCLLALLHHRRGHNAETKRLLLEANELAQARRDGGDAFHRVCCEIASALRSQAEHLPHLQERRQEEQQFIRNTMGALAGVFVLDL